jgi:hypothetical protein
VIMAPMKTRMCLNLKSIFRKGHRKEWMELDSGGCWNERGVFMGFYACPVREVIKWSTLKNVRHIRIFRRLMIYHSGLVRS